jgi:hypothetical protein
MERRYEARLEEMLEDAEVPPEILKGLLRRLETFVEPFAAALDEPAQRRHAVEYMTGLLSNLKHKTGEAIAYLHEQQRQGIQKFIGHVPWGHQPLLATLADQVGDQLGEPDAVIVFDPSGFPKKGTKSVGVARQWCGRLGKVDNCQVGIYMAYVSRKEHAIVDARLYLLDYHLRVGQLARDTRLPEGQALHEQRLDETETGEATTVILIDARRPKEWVEKACHEDVARWLGLNPEAKGLVSWDVFDAVLTPGDIILLTSWRDRGTAEAFGAATKLQEEARSRRVRVVRD